MAGRKSLFDRKFGSDFIKSVPMCAGVYEMLDQSGKTIYVGKAKILRRRLQQYRNARRCKRHLKMRAILNEAHSIRLNPCHNNLEALLVENKLIQELKPRFNVAGAFSFLYPMIGTQQKGSTLYLVYTTSPKDFDGFSFYGAYRSRFITREGYFALLELLSYLGHREPRTALKGFPVVKYAHVAGFRQINERWLKLIDSFLCGDSIEFLSEAVMALLERPMARRNSDEVQEKINNLKRFFRFETRALRQALAANGIAAKTISQKERDALFIKARSIPKAKKPALRIV